MANHELYIAPPPPSRDACGRFTKGSVPANKGKRWEDYMTPDGIERAAKGWQNLDRRPTTRPDNAGRLARPVVAVEDGGRWRIFKQGKHAAEWCGGTRENVCRCCRCNEERHVNRKTGKVNTDHRYKGVRFYYDDDLIWLEKTAR